MKPDPEQLFIQIIEADKNRLFRICRTYADDAEGAKDLFQESLLNIWKALPGFKQESELSTWVYRITINVCLRAREFTYKKDKHFVRLESVKIEPADESTYNKEEEEKNIVRLRAFIQQLSQPDKTIMLLYLEDIAYKEIAAITGLSENHIAVKIKRVKSKLLTHLTS
jgi:RNA polymerase sigma factor (sigma-70 family)